MEAEGAGAGEGEGEGRLRKRLSEVMLCCYELERHELVSVPSLLTGEALLLRT